MKKLTTFGKINLIFCIFIFGFVLTRVITHLIQGEISLSSFTLLPLGVAMIINMYLFKSSVLKEGAAEADGSRKIN
ncbi:hypothetical protein CR194_03955 [Salipaludibacillus keqinensis]|uniref:Uncharacterized protein n=1 Tax=Salipaludibacillus keqinensis TaxID=2045207 RepID=A0A323TL78_9BACI|nr:hypothetical protein [Salipaludibacillus keqinensis]PYZ94694.1 hypothetical protein CR194_03955 [Salipaludibacillus keqinensis]